MDVVGQDALVEGAAMGVMVSGYVLRSKKRSVVMQRIGSTVSQVVFRRIVALAVVVVLFSWLVHCQYPGPWRRT